MTIKSLFEVFTNHTLILATIPTKIYILNKEILLYQLVLPIGMPLQMIPQIQYIPLKTESLIEKVAENLTRASQQAIWNTIPLSSDYCVNNMTVHLD